MHRKITATEALIKTASVEIKAITISGKQMTLAVFRQLEQEPIVEPATGLLVGIPWGRVNYCGKDCRGEHMHVLWQKDNELRHGIVQRDVRSSADYTEWQYVYDRAAEHLILRMLIDGVGSIKRIGHDVWFSIDHEGRHLSGRIPARPIEQRGYPINGFNAGQSDWSVTIRNDAQPPYPTRWFRTYHVANEDGVTTWGHHDYDRAGTVRIRLDGDTLRWTIPTSTPDDVKQAITKSLRANKDAFIDFLTWKQGQTHRTGKSIAERLKASVQDDSLAALFAECANAAGELRTLRDNWEQSWNQLSVTDQLFIAV